MSDNLHPDSAPNTSDGQSAIDQVASILSEEAGETTEASADVEETTTEYEADSYDGEDDGDAETDSPNPEDDDDYEDGAEEGLAALASELGLDSDKLALNEDGEIVVKMRVSGEEKQVTLTEAISGAQYRAANDQKSQKLSEERRTFETERQTVAEEFTGRLQQVQGLGQMLEQQLLSEYNNVDWQALKVTDPATFVIKQQEFGQRQQELQQAGQMVGQQMLQNQQQMEEREKAERAEILASERVAMVDSVPAWEDAEVMKRDLASMVEYGQSLGFSEDDLSNVIHNRELQILRKAMLYDQGQTFAEKKSKTPPKMQRAASGRFISKKDTKLNRLVDRAKNARGGEKRDAQATAVLAILGE